MTDDAGSSTDFGSPAHIIFEDLDSPEHRTAQAGVGAAWTVGPDAGAAGYRIMLLARSGTHNVEDVWILKIKDDSSEYETALHLHGEAAARLVTLMRNNMFDPAAGGPIAPGKPTVLPDAYALAAAYEHEPKALRALIAGDAKADDVVALARRKSVVAQFRRLLDDGDYFSEAVENTPAKSREGVWQHLFESNPWLLGLGLSTQLFASWDPERLERIVAGQDVASPGKRVDALLRTAGAVRLLAFAEIKHHETDLLAREYRSGCWAPSTELTSAVAQSQGTVQLALEKLGPVLHEKAAGFLVPGGETYLYRPRSYVIAGQLSEFVAENGGHNPDQIRSFELFRRNLHEPEVITFDELLSRAEAVVSWLDPRPDGLQHASTP